MVWFEMEGVEEVAAAVDAVALRDVYDSDDGAAVGGEAAADADAVVHVNVNEAGALEEAVDGRAGAVVVVSLTVHAVGIAVAVADVDADEHGDYCD